MYGIVYNEQGEAVLTVGTAQMVLDRDSVNHLIELLRAVQMMQLIGKSK